MPSTEVRKLRRSTSPTPFAMPPPGVASTTRWGSGIASPARRAAPKGNPPCRARDASGRRRATHIVKDENPPRTKLPARHPPPEGDGCSPAGDPTTRTARFGLPADPQPRALSARQRRIAFRPLGHRRRPITIRRHVTAAPDRVVRPKVGSTDASVGKLRIPRPGDPATDEAPSRGLPRSHGLAAVIRLTARLRFG